MSKNEVPEMEQVKSGPYYIWAMHHLSLHRRSVRLCKHKKCYILTAELFDSLEACDEKLYLCKTCQKYLYKIEIQCQAFYNKMAADSIPAELKGLKNKK